MPQPSCHVGPRPLRASSAGNSWQGSSKKRILSLDWKPVSQTHLVDCYEHLVIDASPTCYVDDGSQVCKPQDADRLWGELNELIDTGLVEYDGRYIGCGADAFECKASQL